MDATARQAEQAFATRRIGRVNWLGVLTLLNKEIQRFMKIPLQTIIAPAITTLLFMAIFMLALGGSYRTIGDIPFEKFLVPGLIMMAIIQNAFANTSSSILIAKVQGNIVDVIMPPLSAGELTFGFVIGGMARGIVVAIAVAVPAYFAAPYTIEHIWAVAYFSVSASLLLSMVGTITGIWAEKFDHAASITNFVVMPLSFLSGTFYSIDKLSGIWETISRFNPFFYMIDGFRYGFIGRADGDLMIGVLASLGLNIVFWFVVLAVFRSGYKLKD